MKLRKYVETEVKRRGVYKTQVLKELATKSGVSLLTLQNVERGATMQAYPKAKSVSEATGGKVRVQDLCEA